MTLNKEVKFYSLFVLIDSKHSQILAWIEVQIDKLIQYLTFTIGILDNRLKSEFLIRLEPYKVSSKVCI